MTVCAASLSVGAEDPAALASILQRLHFTGHPRSDAMLAATVPLVTALLARSPGTLNDDGVLLVARRDG
jgi:hypothetical protein